MRVDAVDVLCRTGFPDPVEATTLTVACDQPDRLHQHILVETDEKRLALIDLIDLSTADPEPACIGVEGFARRGLQLDLDVENSRFRHIKARRDTELRSLFCGLHAQSRLIRDDVASPRRARLRQIRTHRRR